jgi:hypothetical protein
MNRSATCWSPLRIGLALAAIACFGSVVTAFARPTIRRSFFTVYPSAVGSKLDNLPSHATHCGVCHFDFNGGGPKNPYGNRVAAVLNSYPNTEAAITAIQNEDSDSDGFSTLTEVTNTATYTNTPTFPGLTPGNVGSCSNIPNVNEITNYLVPTTGSDTQAPTVTVTTPNGGESWVGGTGHQIAWTATDNVGVANVDIFYRDAADHSWEPLALSVANTGTFQWFVQNTPTLQARVKVLARDAAGNSKADSSNANFTIQQTPGGVVATTLRDFKQPGTQPLGGGQFQEAASCITCHGGYNTAAEPGHGWLGSMMGQAARDPLFFACVAVAEQDAPSSGDLCIRCHTPGGWLSGRSTPTDGSQLTALDRDGVACDFCHRAVDPIYKPGVSPLVDQAVLANLLPGHTPGHYTTGQFVVDPDPRKRGPFADAVAPHPFLQSAFHRSSEFCGTCHNVSNPAFNRVAGADYAPGPLDQAAASFDPEVLLPLERTYSEWLHSAFPAGVYAPEFAGNKPGGVVAICQDCHMSDVSGKGCNDPAAPTRADLPYHDMTGGNAWMPPLIGALYPGETDALALSDAKTRAIAILRKAAVLDLTTEWVEDHFVAHVTLTNRSGHKLPTGYPEGRRMWVNVVARDGGGSVIWESGAYDAATGVLSLANDTRVYDAHLGISPALAAAIGKGPGTTFHFALNDTVYKDNRIPPLGFTNAAYAAFGGQPVDHEGAVPRYADNQNWDAIAYELPAATRQVEARLYYQTTSKEYVEFLRDENTTNTKGDELYALWTANGRSTPVLMEEAVVANTLVDVPDGVGARALALRPLSNPFQGELSLQLDLPRPARVTMQVYDLRGRLVAGQDLGELGGGAHRLTWDGRDSGSRDAGVGVFFIRVQVDSQTLVKRVVKQG